MNGHRAVGRLADDGGGVVIAELLKGSVLVG